MSTTNTTRTEQSPAVRTRPSISFDYAWELMHMHFKGWAFDMYDDYPIRIHMASNKNIARAKSLFSKYDNVKVS